MLRKVAASANKESVSTTQNIEDRYFQSNLGRANVFLRLIAAAKFLPDSFMLLDESNVLLEATRANGLRKSIMNCAKKNVSISLEFAHPDVFVVIANVNNEESVCTYF